MSPHRVTVRFPDGQREHIFLQLEPEVGDVLRRNGDEWAVEAATKEEDGTVIVTLRRHVVEAAEESVS